MIHVEFNSLIDAISLVGFPIVMCIAVMLYVKYLTDKNTEQIDRMTERHRDEMLQITKAIENNTLALTQLAERLKGGLNES